MPRDVQSRSRSPYRESSRSKDRHHHRDRDHDTNERHSRHDHSKHKNPKPVLPLRAQPLSKHDLAVYKPLFALYLDVQKEIYIEDLDEREVKGRWKSFVGKWNRGELAEGWYDRQTRDKANASFADADEDNAANQPRGQRDQDAGRISPSRRRYRPHHDAEGSSSEDEVGPSAPRSLTNHAAARAGPTIPNRDDLDMRDGTIYLLLLLQPPHSLQN